MRLNINCILKLQFLVLQYLRLIPAHFSVLVLDHITSMTVRVLDIALEEIKLCEDVQHSFLRTYGTPL